MTEAERAKAAATFGRTTRGGGVKPVHAVDLDGAVREQPCAIVVPEGDVEFRRSHDNLPYGAYYGNAPET
jgi:hypothetical protein